jgi:hypothetical protein
LSASVFAASTVSPPSPRGERPPASNLTKVGAVVTLLAGLGMAGATLLPWMETTNSTFAFLKYSYPGTYQSGGIATLSGLIIAGVAMYLLRGAFWPAERLVASLFMLALSFLLFVVLLVKINEIGTWSSLVTGETARSVSGVFLGAICVAVAVIGSAIAVGAAIVGRRQTTSGHGMTPAMGPGGPVSVPVSQLNSPWATEPTVGIDLI